MAKGNPEIFFIRTLLSAKGISIPIFAILNPDNSRFPALFLQPKGTLRDTPQGLFQVDRAEAIAKSRNFLLKAIKEKVKLCATPEYFFPWEVVAEIAKGKIRPVGDSVWVLGCEAISVAALGALAKETAAEVEWVFEDIQEEGDGRVFFDPVCYIFNAKRDATAEAVLVIVVQFKTWPMGGIDFEQKYLLTGNRVYELSNPDPYHIRIVSLLCSDVLLYPGQFNNLINYFSDQHRLLVLHLQLNKKPRHDVYRAYRSLILGKQHDRELVCLNLAKDVQFVSEGGGNTAWNNDSFSAIYSRRWNSALVNSEDTAKMERKGIYWCYSESLRSHVAVLNFREYVFKFLLSKVNEGGAGETNRPDMPAELTDIFSLDANSDWARDENPIDSEVQAEILACGCDFSGFCDISADPHVFERLAALSVGQLGLADDARKSKWPSMEFVDAFRVDSAEVTQRTTFGQRPRDRS